MTPWGKDDAVQGYVAHGTSTNHNTALEVYQGEFNGNKGDKQPKQFNDVFFAILFGIHLAIMGVLFLASFGGGGGGYYNNGGGSVGGIIYACCVCGVFAAGLSTISLGFMMKFTQQLIQIALFFSVASSLALSILGFLSANLLMGILGLVSFAFGCCYAYFVWSRIPFAAANLNTALTAVRDNLGLTIAAYAFLALALGWSIAWSVATGGLMEAHGGGIAFLLLLSYYWVHQVRHVDVGCSKEQDWELNLMILFFRYFVGSSGMFLFISWVNSHWLFGMLVGLMVFFVIIVYRILCTSQLREPLGLGGLIQLKRPHFVPRQLV